MNSKGASANADPATQASPGAAKASPPYGGCPLREAEDVLQDCRRYLTEFGSVEPSSLVRRVNTALTNIQRERDERCYLWQLASVNGQRIRKGEQPLTYTQFMAGGGE